MSRDTDFIYKISNAVFEQQEHNDQDFSLEISKEQIREETGRRIVRDVVLDDIAERIGEMDGVEASVSDDKVVIFAQSMDNQIFKGTYKTVNELIASNNNAKAENE